MILPDKFAKPSESLFVRGSYILKILLVSDKLNIDDLYGLYNNQNEIWFDDYCNILTFLYIINAIEIKDDLIILKGGITCLNQNKN